MAKIEPLTNNWDRENKERIERNFANLAKLDLEIMHDFLEADPEKLDTKLNGLKRADMQLSSNLNNYGINVTAEVNGVVYRAWVYATQNASVQFGLAEQEPNRVVSAELIVKEYNLKAGWNRVTLNFPLEQNKSYTLFRRNIEFGVPLSRTTISGWGSYPFLKNGLNFNGGKYLDQQGAYLAYTPFYEIEFVTSPAQVYKIANESVKPPQLFYVGDEPPLDVQFWFKPVTGGE